MRVSKLYQIGEVKALKCGYSPIGVPKYQVHLFFVDGLLIDTGPSRMEKAVLKFVENNAVKQVFVTHHHEDHTGNLAALKKQLNVPFWASAKCRTLMKNPPKMSMPPKIFWGNRGAFHLDVLENDVLETENHKFQLIPLPGHAEDMFGLYEKEKAWFFSADAYVHTHIRYFFYRESVKQQIETIKKILHLDFDKCPPDHIFKNKYSFSSIFCNI